MLTTAQTLLLANVNRYAIEILNEGRVGIAAQMVGIAQGSFNKSVPYTFDRKQFGQPVGTVSLPSRNPCSKSRASVIVSRRATDTFDVCHFSQFQGMQMQFAEVATEIEAARLLCYNAARMKEQGVNFTKQAAMAKWYSSIVAQKAAGSAIEWAGGLGYTRETGIERFWRDSKSESSSKRITVFPSLPADCSRN